MLHAVPRSAGDDRFHRSGLGNPARPWSPPLRTIGVSGRLQRWSRTLIRDELEARRVGVLPEKASCRPTCRRGAEACAEAACAAAAAAESRRVARRLRFGESARSQVHRADPNHSTRRDQPRVRRPAHAQPTKRISTPWHAAAPTASSPDWHCIPETASVKNITEEKRLEPRRRASRSPASVGLRAGFHCSPPRSTVMAAPKRSDHGALLRSKCGFREVPRRHDRRVLGFAWHGDTIEWTILDIFVARIFEQRLCAVSGRRSWRARARHQASVTHFAQTTMIPTSIHRTVSLRRR